MPNIVGIDLGTTNSLVATVSDGIPKIIASPGAQTLVPSMIHFSNDGNVHVGQEARDRMLDESGHTISSIKRFMGRGLAEGQEDLKLLPFTASSDSENIIRINISLASPHHPTYKPRQGDISRCKQQKPEAFQSQIQIDQHPQELVRHRKERRILFHRN